MSYGLTFNDAPEAAVERVRREQREGAAEALEAGDDPVGRRIYAERPKTFSGRVRRYVDLAAA